MKNWQSLFISQGFMVEEVNNQVFNVKQETVDNVTFLLESLDRLTTSYVMEGHHLVINSPVVTEESWLEAVDVRSRVGGGDICYRPGKDEIQIRYIDTYISGVIRQLNRLGLYTSICCDGHDRRRPNIGFGDGVDMELVQAVFQSAVGLEINTNIPRNVSFRISRYDLLDLAVRMNQIKPEWLEKGVEFMKKQLFLQKLEQCLSINGESGNEQEIRDFVSRTLKPHVDFLKVDAAGNLLAQKTCGTGHGPTILFNAHLDTVDVIEKDREIVKDGQIWSSSHGILGADDRAGVAVLLELAQRLNTIRFNGKVKFIFTVEEEVGLVGARAVNEIFLWDVDAAFVVDRRGKGDIVTSCGGYEPFCYESFGEFMEEVALSQGLAGWKCTPGGSSDTRIWASYGIQSVNLSVGYQHEHTDFETLDTNACYDTLSLLMGVLEKSRELGRVVHRIKARSNQLNNYAFAR
jgi:putative aminopeptidase FrvX